MQTDSTNPVSEKGPDLTEPPKVQVMINKRQFFSEFVHSWSIWKSLDVVLFVGVLIAAGYLMYQAKTTDKIADTSSKHYLSTSLSSSSPSIPKTTKNSNSGTAPTTPTTSKTTTSTPGVVTTDYITIPTGLNESERNSTSNNDIGNDIFPGNSFGVGGPINSITSDYAATASGHYVYIDTSVGNNSTTDNGGKLIYDGKTIAQNSNIVPYSEIISQNGLHYAYITDDGTNYHIFIDNVSSYTLSDSNQLVLYDLSNDGKTIVYDYQDDNADDILYQNGTVLQSLVTLEIEAFSSDLQHSIIGATDNNGDDQVILNGKAVLAADSDDLVAMSENGMHYAYVSVPASNANSLDLNVDGQDRGFIIDPGNLGVDDNGDYFYLDEQDSILYINKQQIQLNSTDVNDSESSDLLLSVNSNASHYLVSNPSQDYYFLDGKVTSLTGDIFQTEFSGNTLYVYKFSN